MKHLVIALVLGIAISAQANELSLFQTVTNVNMASAGLGGLRQIGTGNLVLTNVPAGATIKQAFLYWHGPINDTASTTPVSATINGQNYPGVSIGISDANCWSQYNLITSRACRADVTGAITGNGTYTVSNLAPLGLNANGVSLLVFYDDGDASNNRNYVIYDGNDSNVGTQWDLISWNLSVSGLNFPGGTARLQLHVSDGQSPFDGAVLLNGGVLIPGGSTFQGDSVPTVPGMLTFVKNADGTTTEFGGLWDIRTVDISSFLTVGQNQVSLGMGDTVDCLSLIVAIFDLPPGPPSPPPPATNHAPQLSCDASFKIEANIKSGQAVAAVSTSFWDADGDALRVTWYTNNIAVSMTDYPATAPNVVRTNDLLIVLVPGQTYSFTATVTDFYSAPQPCGFSVDVIDGIAPVVVCPTNDTPIQVSIGQGTTVPLPDLRPLLQMSDNVTPNPLLKVTQVPDVGTPVGLGELQVTFSVQDQALNIGTCSTIFLLVDPTVRPNHNPVANPDFFATGDGVPLVITGASLLANDTDVDGDPLTITSVSSQVGGTVVANGDGTYTFTPAAGFHGAASFTYSISDGHGGSATGTVTISVNGNPVAVNDAVTTNEDTPVFINVLGNDSDPDKDTLTILGLSQPAHGTAVVLAGGTGVQYSPAANYNGTDTFTYTITDGHNGTATATVTITILPVVDPPIAVADMATTPEETPVVISVLANDINVDGGPLTIVSVGAPQHGSVTVGTSGTVRYAPAPLFYGNDNFTYTIQDASGNQSTAMVTVNVSFVDHPPTANPDSALTTPGMAVNIDVLANDSDVDGDSLTVSAVTSPVHGTVINNGGNVTYTAASNYAGLDTFTYTATDSHGSSATALVTVAVVAHCDLYPIALNIQNVANVPVGTIIKDILNGTQPGNFGWLTWAGSSSEPTLVTSLRIPGNSGTYINPNNPSDHTVSVGDWVSGSTGLSNSSGVRTALDLLETIDITVPVWDQSISSGNNTLYHVINFAKVRLVGYKLPNKNVISAKFLGFTLCSETGAKTP